jgi:hypothetical protein
MIKPNVFPRIEQVDLIASFGIDARKISCLMKIALRATPRKVLWIIIAAMDASKNVVDVKRPFICFFR